MATPDPTVTAWVPLWNTGGAAGGGGGGGGGGGLHAPSHGVAGGDPVALDASQIVSGVILRARLPAEIAYLNVDQNFTGRNDFHNLVVFRGGGAGAPLFYAVSPLVNFYDTSRPADLHYSRIAWAAGAFYVQTLRDDYTVSGQAYIDCNGLLITNLNAAALTTGIAAPARLGSGAPSLSTFLRGDGVWAAPPTGTGAGVPAGLIAIFDTACPAGWTRVAALDDRFPRGAPAYGGAGGVFTHSHLTAATGPAGGHYHDFAASGSGSGSGRTDPTDAGIVTVPTQAGGFQTMGIGHSHTFGVSVGVSVNGSTASVGDHSHGGGATDQADHTPPYLMVVFCRKD